MTELFAPGFVDRLQAQWPDVDVHVLAALVREWAEREHASSDAGVRNPSGLLVTWTRRAAAQVAERRVADQAKYAELHAEIYRLLAVRRLSPVQVAGLLRGAAGSGFGKLNPLTISRLERMGAAWPDAP